MAQVVGQPQPGDDPASVHEHCVNERGIEISEAQLRSSKHLETVALVEPHPPKAERPLTAPPVHVRSAEVKGSVVHTTHRHLEGPASAIRVAGYEVGRLAASRETNVDVFARTPASIRGTSDAGEVPALDLHLYRRPVWHVCAPATSRVGSLPASARFD